MDDIDIEEFELNTDEKPVEVIPDGGIQNEEEIVKWADVFADYLGLPTKAIYTFSTLTVRQRTDACGLGWAHFFKTYKIVGNPPKIDAINEAFKVRHRRGWNSGLFCKTIIDVNRALAFYGQCEFIPALGENGTIFWCSKVNYQSLPITPGDPTKLRLLSAFISLGAKGMEAKRFPDNFVNAVVTSNNKKWRGSNFAKQVLVTAVTYCTQPHQVSIYVGEANAVKYLKSISDFDPTSARKIQPASTRSPSIFSNCIPQYLELFSIVGRDQFGPVSTERMLASHYDGDGFYGFCSDVTMWLTKSTVIKCQNVPSSIINHHLLDYYDNRNWPRDCVMYACTPQDITTYTTLYKKPPKAVVIPFQSAISGGKHIQALVQSSAKVRILIHFAETPLVSFVTRKASKGFNTNSLVSNLAALEKEVVVKMLEIMKQQLLCEEHYLSWECKPAETYGPGKCHILWKEITTPMLYNRQVYMSNKDMEKAMFTPTGHASEILVDGKKVSHVADQGIAANYKRCNPAFVANCNTILTPGTWYDSDGKPLAKQPKRPNLFADVSDGVLNAGTVIESIYQMVPQAVGSAVEDVMSVRPSKVVNTKAGAMYVAAKRKLALLKAEMLASKAELADYETVCADKLKEAKVNARKEITKFEEEIAASKDEVYRNACALDIAKVEEKLVAFDKSLEEAKKKKTKKHEDYVTEAKIAMKGHEKDVQKWKKEASKSAKEAQAAEVSESSEEEEEEEEESSEEKSGEKATGTTDMEGTD